MPLYRGSRWLVLQRRVAVAAGVTPASFNAIYGDSQDIAFGSSTYTSPSQTWVSGTALVFVYDAVNRGSLAVTIKGVSATQVGAYGGSTNRGSLWKATVTSGAGTVVVVAPLALATISTAGIVISSTSSSPSATPSIADIGSNAAPFTLPTVTVPANGLAVTFGAGDTGAADPRVASWTGVTNNTTMSGFINSGNGTGIVSGTTLTAGSLTPTLTPANSSMNFDGATGVLSTIAWGP